MALKALEFSAHKRIDAGERLDDVVRELLGDGLVSGAPLLVIVDLVLSHSSLDGPLLTELVASTELLTLDATRAQHDVANKMAGGKFGLYPQGGHPSHAAIEQSLAERTPGRRIDRFGRRCRRNGGLLLRPGSATGADPRKGANGRSLHAVGSINGPRAWRRID